MFKRAWQFLSRAMLVSFFGFAFLIGVEAYTEKGRGFVEEVTETFTLAANVAIVLTAGAVWVEYWRKLHRDRGKRKLRTSNSVRIGKLEAETKSLRSVVDLMSKQLDGN